MSDNNPTPSDPFGTLPSTSGRSEKIDKLLDAALLEFGRAGPDGARVAAIAAAAGMNKRLLYHYVGDKTALFAAVLERSCARVAEHPDTPMPLEWRVICHAAAAGGDGLQDIPTYLADERSEIAAARLGLMLLVSLLPDLADRVLSNEAGSVEGRESAMHQALDRLAGGGGRTETGQPVGPKPRLKMRPELRASVSAGS